MTKRNSEIEQSLIDKGTTITDDQPVVQTVAESDLARVAAEEAFMHEKVKILIHATVDPYAPPYFRGGVGQHQETVFREVPTYVYRKTLEVLARMKETRVSQDLTPSPTGEITAGHLRGHTGLAYPFVVLEDKNPKGSAWLANILAERG